LSKELKDIKISHMKILEKEIETEIQKTCKRLAELNKELIQDYKKSRRF